jgi:hypothetical protein
LEGNIRYLIINGAEGILRELFEIGLVGWWVIGKG